MSEDNGKARDNGLNVGNLKYTLSITYDVGTEQFLCEGLNTPPWVALGMLEYLGILIRRRDAELAMITMQRAAPRIAVPGGRL